MSALRHACSAVAVALLATSVAPAAEPLVSPPAPLPPPSSPQEDLAPSPPSEASRTDNAPFIDTSAGMVLIDDRWESTFALAIRLGFHAERFGFAGRIGSNVSPSYSESVPVGHATDHDFVRAPALFLQLSAGYAIWATDGFVSTPSLSVLRTDNPAYGTALGLEWPFIWVTHRRLRIGFEPGFWAAFGGYQVAYCNDPTAGCAQDARVELGRPFGYGLSCNFVFGFELGRS